ncbi:negative elongation factor E-like [Littorina saxatilis]|uniref:Negative elongation factor E n=1 Tax=Littorina saxatilis TaxID=31220 RepID=A0AAN9G5J9_9CAEN
MVLTFPNALTEEEEMLKQKYARLRKKRKQLQALKTAKPETQQKPSSQSAKRPAESAGEATEQAKKLVQSGAIKVGSGSKEKSGFKRSRNQEKRLKESDKHPAAVGFQPFSATHSGEEDEKIESPKPKIKGLYESFVTPASKFDGDQRRDRDDRRERDDRRDREPPRKGNTVYVNGVGVTEDILKRAFSNFGNIVNINVERERNNGFVTFEKTESADQAIADMNGSLVSNVQLKVMMARRQPTFESISDPSTSSWSVIAASHSQKGPARKDSRDLVTYEDDIF